MARELNDDQVDHIRALLEGEGKIQAIKVYREITGCSLAEAKGDVERIESAQSLNSDELKGSSLDRVKSALASGNKIEAIKRHREATGSGLKEAKEAVEAMIASGDVKWDKDRAHAKATSRGCGAMFLLAVGLAIALGVIWPG